MHFLARNKLKRIIWVQPSAFLANCLGKIGHALFSGHCLFALISLVFYSWLDLSAKGCTFRGASLELPEGGLCVHLYYFLATSVPWSMFRCVQRKGKRILGLLLPSANGLAFFIFSVYSFVYAALEIFTRRMHWCTWHGQWSTRFLVPSNGSHGDWILLLVIAPGPVHTAY